MVVRESGKTIVIHAGPTADLTRLNQVWASGYGDLRSSMRRTDAECSKEALRRVGIETGAVDFVLHTPLQAYPAGNVPLFPRATVCISRRGWIEDFHAPPWPTHVPRDLCIPNEVLVYLKTQPWDCVRLIEDDEEVLPDIRARWVGTRHRSSITFLVETAAGIVAISDCFFKYPNFGQDIPLGVQESMVECMRSYALIPRSANLIVPLFDPDVPRKHPGGKIP